MLVVIKNLSWAIEVVYIAIGILKQCALAPALTHVNTL